ncbi:MAG: transcription antitermination factor NusB [Vulcanimicrobiota bacterium]
MKKNKQYKARDLAYKIMFSTLAGNEDVNDALTAILDQLDGSEKSDLSPMVKEKVHTWKNNREIIDEIVKKLLKKSKFEDLANVALTSLRLGITEVGFIEEIPSRVAINEAVELTKTYGDPHLSRFVNGVLDAYYKSLKTEGVVDGEK